ncbi:HEAT repeat domain-containing protein [candidate division KSB1 bacterium]|nr:HEAT repeat domain-containing protein [candidate division KSB1 bacterium]
MSTSNLDKVDDLQKAREYARQDLPALLAFCAGLIKKASEPERESYAAAIADEALAAKTTKDVVRAFAIDDEPGMRIFAAQVLQHCSPNSDLFLGLAQWLATDGDQTVAEAGFKVLGRWLESNNRVDGFVKDLLDSKLISTHQAAHRILAHATSEYGTRKSSQTLEDKDFDVQLKASKDSNHLSTPGTLETLIRSLKDENWSVRQNAASTLGRLGDLRAAMPLLETLRDEDADVRQSATGALGQLGSVVALQALLRVLADKDAAVRQSAAQALGQLGDAGAVRALLRALKDENESVRKSAVQALGQLGDVRAIEPLLTALEDKSEEVRKSAALALGRLGRGNVQLFVQLERLALGRRGRDDSQFFTQLNALDSDELDTWNNLHDLCYAACLAINSLVAIYPERAFRLAEEKLRLSGNNLVQRSLFLEIIGRCAFLGIQGAVDAIEDLRKSDKSSERADAAALLGELLPVKTNHILEAFEKLADDDDWIVREAVAIPLAHRSLFCAQATEKILHALSDDEEIAVVYSALTALELVTGQQGVFLAQRRLRRYAKSSRRSKFLDRWHYKLQERTRGGFGPSFSTNLFGSDATLQNTAIDEKDEPDLAALNWQQIERYKVLEARVKEEEAAVQEARVRYDQHQKDRERRQGVAAIGAVVAIVALVIDLANRLLNSDSNALGIILPLCIIALIIVVAMYITWGTRSRELGAWLLEIEDRYTEDRRKLREVIVRYRVNSIEELVQRRLQSVELGFIEPELFYEKEDESRRSLVGLTELPYPKHRKVNRDELRLLLQQLEYFVTGQKQSLEALERLLRLLPEPLIFYFIYKQLRDGQSRSVCRLFYDSASLIDRIESAEFFRERETARLRNQLPRLLEQLAQGFRELPLFEYREERAAQFLSLRQLLIASSLPEILRALTASEKELSSLSKGRHKLREEDDLGRLLIKLNQAINPLRQYSEEATLSLRVVPLSETISNLEETARLISFEGIEPYRTILMQVISNWRELLRLEIRRLEGEAKLEFSTVEEVTAGETITVVLEIRNNGPAPASNFRVKLQGKGLFGIQPTAQTIPSLAANESKTLTFSARSRAKRFIAEFLITYDDLLAKAKDRRYTATIAVRTPVRAWKKISNPYQPGLPTPEAVERLFVGRKDVLNFIEENLVGSETERIVVLYGHRRTGKTWMLLRLQERLPATYLPIYIDVQEFTGITGVPAVLQIFADEIFRMLKEKSEIDAKTFSTIRIPTLEQYEQNYAYYFKRSFLDDVQKILGERKLLWLVDEFQGLDDMVVSGKLPATFMEFLRDLMQFGKKMAFVFAGTREMTGRYWSVFFNIAVQRKIGVLNDAEAAKLIIDPVKPFGVEHDRFAVPLVKQLTGNHPYFIQLLCDRIVSELNARQQMLVNAQIIEAAVSDLVINGASNLKFYWAEVMDEKERAVCGTMQELLRRREHADVSNIWKAMSEINPLIAAKEVSTALKSLVEKDLLEKDKTRLDTYQFKIGLVERYIGAHIPYAETQERIGKFYGRQTREEEEVDDILEPLLQG